MYDHDERRRKKTNWNGWNDFNKKKKPPATIIMDAMFE